MADIKHSYKISILYHSSFDNKKQEDYKYEILKR